MENEIEAYKPVYKNGLPDASNIIEENGYYAALKKNEHTVFSIIKDSGENLSE